MSMTRFRFGGPPWPEKRPSNLLDRSAPERMMPRRLKCLISAHIVCKKLHFGISWGYYPFVFMQKVRP
jgi:hypothetical protein